MKTLNIWFQLLFNRLISGRVRGYEDVHISRCDPEEAAEIRRMARDQTWPAVMEGLLYSVTVFIDTAVVSTMGTLGLNAVSICYQPRMMIMCLTLSLNVGIMAMIARYKGRNDREGANRAMRQGLILSAVASAVPMILSFIFARPFLLVAGALPSYAEDAVVYFRNFLYGNYLYAVSTTICAMQRGSGNSRVAMVSNFTGNIVRVIASYALIHGLFGLPALGILGAAIGSNISYGVMFLITVVSILRKDSFINLQYKVTGDKEFIRKMNASVRRISLSAAAEQFSYRFGMLIFVRMISVLGNAEYSAYNICTILISIPYEISARLAESSAALTGQALGAKRPDRAIIFNDLEQLTGFYTSLLSAVILLVFKYPLIGLYSKDPEVVPLCANLMYVVALMCLIESFALVEPGSLRGAGDTRYVAVFTLISTAVIRPIVSYLLIYPVGMGAYGAWAAMTLDQTMKFLLFRNRFKEGKWIHIMDV